MRTLGPNERRARAAGRAAGVLLLAVAAACRNVEAIDLAPSWPTPERGMVVSEHRLATEVGASILDRGGNAADAAVATALALAVVYPIAGNLGGGGFCIFVPHDGAPRALDFREVAPVNATPEVYLDERGQVEAERAQVGALAVGVPGSPAGLFELHKTHGSRRLTWSELVRPARMLAERGFLVDSELARDLADEVTRARMAANPAARAIFQPAGRPLAEGERLVQPDLARLLEALAQGGPRAFYTGAYAELCVREVARLASAVELAEPWITKHDLETYQPVWRQPLRGWFRGHEIIAMPPPSSGGIILLQALAVLEGLPLEAERAAALAERELRGADLSERGYGPAFGIDERLLHWWIEVLRWTFAGRAQYMGDPDFVEVPVAELLSPEWIAACRVGIGESAAPGLQPSLPEPQLESAETTHVSVIDADGNAVSLTTTLNSAFGSCAVVPGAGYLLNNEMDDFALAATVPNQFGLVGSGANQIAGGKRPLSSMTPTVVRDGGHAVSLVIGSPGGPRIISSVLGVLLRTLAFGEDLESAVRAPRVHQQWRPEWTEFEPGWDAELLELLRTRRGHDARAVERRWGSVQAIEIPLGGEPVGVSDPRRSGTVQAQREL